MMPRIGIRAKLKTLPKAIYSKRASKLEFPVWMAGWGSASGGISNPLRALVASKIREKGYGTVNYVGYSNPKVDSTLDQAIMTVDDEERCSLLIQTQGLAMEEAAVIPIHFESRSWAMRNDLVNKGRPDEFTIVSEVKKF